MTPAEAKHGFWEETRELRRLLRVERALARRAGALSVREKHLAEAAKLDHQIWSAQRHWLAACGAITG